MAMKFESKPFQGLLGPATRVTIKDDEQPGFEQEIIADKQGIRFSEGRLQFFDAFHMQILAQAIGTAAKAFIDKYKFRPQTKSGH